MNRDSRGRFCKAKYSMDVTSLISWLETKDPKGTYRYTDPCGCLIFQFLKAVGKSVYDVGPNEWTDIETRRDHPLPKGFEEISVGKLDDNSFDWTFGGALKRAKEYVK